MLNFKCPDDGTDEDFHDIGSDTKVRETSFGFDSFRQLSTAFLPQQVAFETRLWPKQDCDYVHLTQSRFWTTSRTKKVGGADITVHYLLEFLWSTEYREY